MANNEKVMNEVFALETNNKNVAKNILDNKYKLITTWILFFCSLVYGMTSYIIGPALNDMEIKLNTTTDSITIVFACMLIGYTLGAIINGIIFNYINRQLILTCLLLMMSCTITLAPYCPNLGLLFVDGGLSGFGAGGLDTALVVWIIELWAEKSSLYLQGYQFFTSLGNFISPLMTRPFLAEELADNSSDASNVTAFTVNRIVEDLTAQKNNTESVKHYTESRIEIPFGIVGSLLLTSGLILLCLHFYRRYVPPIDPNDEFVCKCPQKWEIIYIILGLSTIAPYVGMEVMNFQLMPSFAKFSHLKLSASDSALVQTVMAFAFTLFRGITFVVSIWFWSEKVIFINIIAIFAGNIILILYEIHEYTKTVLWVGTFILGTGFSCVFPSVYAFLESQLTVSNTIGGLLVCVSGLIAAILPTVCGQFIETSPLTLIYLNLICTTIIFTSFTIFNLIIYIRSKNR